MTDTESEAVAWRLKIGRGVYGYSEAESDVDWHIKQANVDPRFTTVDKAPLFPASSLGELYT
jgi:hypothetical protein